MSRKINYRKSNENGWCFTSKKDGNGLYVYYMSSGRYTTDPLSCKGRIKARFDIYNHPYLRSVYDSFYCKEDADEVLEDNKMYFVTYFDPHDFNVYLSDRKTILSSLPSRDEAMSQFFERYEFEEEDYKLFNELLVKNNNHLSYTCCEFTDIIGCLENHCFLFTYVPPISFKRST